MDKLVYTLAPDAHATGGKVAACILEVRPSIAAGIDAATNDDIVLTTPEMCVGIASRVTDFGGPGSRPVHGEWACLDDYQSRGSPPTRHHGEWRVDPRPPNCR